MGCLVSWLRQEKSEMGEDWTFSQLTQHAQHVRQDTRYRLDKMKASSHRLKQKGDWIADLRCKCSPERAECDARIASNSAK